MASLHPFIKCYKYLTKGGPLVVEESDGHWHLAGLISQPMCDSSDESIYTDMAKYTLPN